MVRRHAGARLPRDHARDPGHRSGPFAGHEFLPTLEEPPFFAGPDRGRAVHARKLKAAKAEDALRRSLEMIGHFRDERGSQSYPLPWPALMITDTPFLRNPHYHPPTDTAHTLDYRRMAEVVRLVHAGLLEMAKTGPKARD